MERPITKSHFLKVYFDYIGWTFHDNVAFMEDGTLSHISPLRITRSQSQVMIAYHPSIIVDQTKISSEMANQEIIEVLFGPNVHYLEHQSFVMFSSEGLFLPNVDGLAIETLPAERKLDLGKLKSVCTKEEVMASQVGLEDDFIIGIYHQKDLLAAGSLWYLGDDLADIHLLTHPKFRSIGLGKILLMSLINRAFHMEKIPMVRGNLNDSAAYRVAKTCGLTEALSHFEIELMQ